MAKISSLRSSDYTAALKPQCLISAAKIQLGPEIGVRVSKKNCRSGEEEVCNEYCCYTANYVGCQSADNGIT
jgi:hypothetical protein